MALPSQSVRPNARRNYMYSRSRRRRLPRLMVFTVVLAIVILLTWWVRPWGEDVPSNAASDAMDTGAATEIVASADDQELPARSSSPVDSVPTEFSPHATAPPPAAASPVIIEMGKAAPDLPSSPSEPKADANPEPTRPAGAVERDSAPSASDAAPAPPLSEPAPSAAPTSRIAAGLDLLARNRPLEARRTLTQALLTDALPPQDAELVRDRLATLNERLVFSPEVINGDSFTLTYTLQSGDALSKVPRRLGVQTEWQFIKRINRIADERRIQAGQRVKAVTGPFHAIIDKSDFRLDLFLGDESDLVYIRSFPVGLGEFNSTPEGRFRVRENSKLINPQWRNPRTGELFLPADPKNPIGEHWIGLVGDEPHLQDVVGYGIHGTIEPDSIGRQSSMGCIRMHAQDVAVVWETLMDEVSTVLIRP